MKNHEEIELMLSDFRDGELPAAQREEIAAHLEACSACRARLTLLARASAALLRPGKRPTAFETERFVRSVMEKVERRSPLAALLGRRWAAPTLALGLAAAIAAVALPSYFETADPAESMLAQDDGVFTWLAGRTDVAATLDLEDR